MSNASSKEEKQLQNPKKRYFLVVKGGNPRGLGNPWLVILITALIFILSQFAAAIITAIVLNVVHPHASLSTFLDQSAPTQFFYVLIAEGLAACLSIFVVKEIRRLPLSTIGLGRWPQLRDVGRALAGALVFYLLLIAASVVINFFVPNINNNENQDVGFNTLNSSLDAVLALLALVVLPPLGEETLMRGYLYSGLRARWRFIPAMLVTSVLFGAAHLGGGDNGNALWIAGVDTFLLSIVLVYLREKSGALYAGMLLHATNNLIAFTVHFHGLMILPF